MKRYLILLAGLLILGFSSCQKDPIIKPEKPGSMADLKVSNQFDWKTTQNVEVQVQGLQLPVQVQRTIVISDGQQAVFYKGMQAMNANVTYNIVVPAYLRELKVSFGTISKTLPIQNGKVVFNYIPNLPETDN
ncbi:MAG: hypothetical protein IPM52_11625 [Bacteroidetes bacterium]|nr:hypothetical protein [Bacteroidota bacterium]